MFFVRNIRKDLENLKTGLGTLTFIELRLLQKILEIIFMRHLMFIYPLLTGVSLNDSYSNFKPILIEESTRLKLEETPNLLAIELLELSIPVFLSPGV